MSASSALRAALVIGPGVVAFACSFIADFDASKLPREGSRGVPDGSAATAGSGGASASGARTGTMSGGAAAGEGGVSASAGAGAADASLGRGGSGAENEGGNGGDDGTPPACDVSTNAGCAADELCCPVGQGVTCRKTSPDECENCGVACPTGVTAACTARTCECGPGSGRVCTGRDAERFCAGSPASCVACRDATDCAGRSDGKTRCVAGQCAECDAAQASAGCSGNKPVCDATTHSCRACVRSPDDCPKPLVCTTTGACGHCGGAVDCKTPTSPICDVGTTQCRPCASNAECAAGPKLPYCISQTCSSCNPTTEVGCTDATKPDCRGDASGGFSCQACTNNAHCANRPGTVCDAATGRCVACSSDNDCANPKTPLCVNNVCVACDTTSTIALLTDLRCVLKAGGQPACIRSGTQKGQCGACDPGDSRGCNGNQLCCESGGVAACIGTSTTQCAACSGACDPLLASTCSNRTCRCGSSAPCAGSGAQRFCVASGCVECRNDSDCTDATLNQCNPATAACVDCIDNGGCSGTLDRCDVVAHKCVDCDATGGCAGVPQTPICVASACTACKTDAQCAALVGSPGPLCSASGACVADATCTRNADCVDGIHLVCAGLHADGGGTGRCRVCDPLTSAGCTGTQKCSADFVCTG